MWKERVKQLMEDKQINQKELSRLSGITEASVSRYLKGDRTPRIDIITNFARVFGVDVDYLIGDEFPNMKAFDTISNAIARSGNDLTDEEKEKLIALLNGQK